MPRRPRLIFQDNALLDPARQATLLDAAKRAGGTGIQQDVAWGDVRRGGTYDWGKLDALVNAANARGEAPQFRLMGTSSTMKASNPGADMALNTANPNANLLGQFARDVATHFGGRVSKYSIWNEPNIGPSSRLSPHAAAVQYRRLYQAGYAGIKAANRNAKVGFGEVTTTTPEDTSGRSTVGFLNEVLRSGNKRLKADYVAIHPYQWTNPSKPPPGMSRMYGGISNLPAVQQALAGAFRKGRLATTTGKRPDLALSEFGYLHSAVPNARKRAQYLARALQLARTANVSSVNLYQMVPNLHAGSRWDTSVMDPQGQMDPVLHQALKKMRRA